MSANDRKFAWHARMYHDPQIPLGQRAILSYCGIRYAMAPDYVITVRQETIAANLHVHVNTVANAFRTGQRQGWLRKRAERERGRGKHGADTWELTTPGEVIPTPDCAYYDEEIRTPDCGSSEKYPHETAEIPTRETPKYPHETAEIPTTANAATSENDPPKGFIEKGFIEKGFQRDGYARADGPPAVNGEAIDTDDERAAVLAAWDAHMRRYDRPAGGPGGDQ